MEKRSQTIRAALLQLLGLASLLAYLYSRNMTEPFPLFHRLACYLLYPLGVCLLAYVLWMLFVRGVGLHIRPAVPRIIFSVLPALLILLYGVIHLIYWLMGWRPVGVEDMSAQLEAAVLHPIAIGVMAAAMLFLVLGLETRPPKVKDEDVPSLIAAK